MIAMLLLACFLALLWGAFWALFLQFTPLGRWLVMRRTWVAAVVGVGVDLLIVLAILPFDSWLWLVVIIALSAIPIVVCSLLNEHEGEEELLNAHDVQD
jgi:hypothetical protein